MSLVESSSAHGSGGAPTAVPGLSPEKSAADSTALLRMHRSQMRLVEAVQQLSLARTVAAIQEIVRHAAREIAWADGATFVLRDKECCFYADEDAISPLWKGQRFPMSACISGWTMLHSEPAVIPDIYRDSRVPIDAYRPTFVRSLVMVPIRTESPIGAIGNYWATRHLATEEEEQGLFLAGSATEFSVGPFLDAGGVGPAVHDPADEPVG